MQRWLLGLASLLSAGLMAACGGGGSDTPAASNGSLAQELETSGSTRTMASAVSTAGLTELLSGDRKYTLLMPTDEAMQPYGEELAELTKPENRAALQDYVKAHVVDGELLAQTIKDVAAAGKAMPMSASGASTAAGSVSITIRNLLGDELEIAFSNNVVTINGAPLVRGDLFARNGVLQIFGAPLFRPSVFGVVMALRQTSTLEAAIRAAGLVQTLRGQGPFTLFAPTNDAFAKLLVELNLSAQQLLTNKPLLQQVLAYHVLASRVLAGQIENGATPTTVQGQSLTFEVGSDAFKSPTVAVIDARDRRANVSFTNLRARNGMVHLVDRVFLPTDKNLVAVASANPQFSILVEAVVAAGLVDTLSGLGPFTVFAPTNDAFVALLGELGLSKAALLANKPLLNQVLTYHVLASRSLASTLTDGLARQTVEGQPISFKRDAQGLSIVDAKGRRSKVVIANVQATNGVVHAIDKVILPTDKNLVAVASANPQFSILVEAVVAAGLVDTLNGTGPFTVFAPTNDAFAALLGELGLTKAQLLANTSLLTQVLTYHVLPGQVLSSGIPFGQPVTTVQGQTLTIGRDLKITDQRQRRAGIVATDVAATNGVVHVIDKVILPK